METAGTNMRTPGGVAAPYSFLFPIGESRHFKPSHPTIRAMCVNGTFSLASSAWRPRDLLPHSAPSGMPCCPRSHVTRSGVEEPPEIHPRRYPTLNQRCPFFISQSFSCRSDSGPKHHNPVRPRQGVLRFEEMPSHFSMVPSLSHVLSLEPAR